jgi:hypothetical protein
MASYTLISSVTVGAGGASSIDFTSIPQTYTDLQVVTSMRSTRSGVSNEITFLRINGDTGSNYYYNFLRGDGSTAASGTGSAITGIYVASTPAGNATASIFQNGSIYIAKYTGTVDIKSVMSSSRMENNGTTGVWTESMAAIWNSTSAVTSLKLYLENGPTYAQYTTAYLYGIKNA